MDSTAQATLILAQDSAILTVHDNHGADQAKRLNYLKDVTDGSHHSNR